MVRVRVLREHDEPARVVRPIAEVVKVERAPHRGCLRRRLDPREGVAVSHAPPPFHVDLHRRGQIQGGVTLHRNRRRIHG